LAVAQRSETRGRQVITPRARRIDKVRSRRKGVVDVGKIVETVASFVRPAAIVIAVALLFFGYRALTNSRLFELNSVTVSDASTDLREDIEQAVRRVVGQTRLLSVDLAAIKKKVEEIPRVRTATVARSLPDGIFVRVVERKPSVLALRQSGTVVWLDEEAVEMGEYSDLSDKTGVAQTVPPIVKGFAESNRSSAAIADDRDRVAIYKKIEQDFSEGPAYLWDSIDQIDLAYTKDVNIQVAHSPVVVHVGSSDFRRRFQLAISVLEAAKRADAEALLRLTVRDPEELIEKADIINFIDAARPDRIVVTFATPGAQKAARQESSQKQAPKKRTER
jgi:POTRA domain, FtsQ-type